MKKVNFIMRRLSLMLTAIALPLFGAAQRVFLPYGYTARGGMSYCPNTYLPGWMAVDPSQPVQDAAFLIANPSFEEGVGTWSGIESSDIIGETGHKYAYKSGGKFDVYQVIENIPNGVYELSVRGFYEGEKTKREAYVYAGMEAMALKSKAEGTGDLSSSRYASTVRAVVINHRLRIGVKGVYTNGGPTSFDDFSLTYVGSYVVGFATEIAEGYEGIETIEWAAGDEVAIHAGEAVYKYKAVSGGTRTMLVAADNNNNNNQFPQLGLTYIATRPYDEAGTLTIPQEQTGIDASSNPMAAKVEDASATLQFKNVCGLLQLNLKGDGVSVQSITVKANDGKSLCGTGVLDFNGGNPTWSCTDGDDDEVTLNSSLISLSSISVPFYIALPPATYSGLTVTVTDGVDGNVCEEEFDNVVIGRSVVTARDMEVVYKSLELSHTRIGLHVNENCDLTANVVPANSTVTWTSNGTNIATVSSSSGNTVTVTAKAVGSTTITARATNGLTATCTVTVAPVGAIPGLFSVNGDGTQVYFSKGNMYWDGNSYEFEANQYDYRMHYENSGDDAVIDGMVKETPDNTVGSFLWVNNLQNTLIPYGWNVGTLSGATGDFLFTNADATTPNPSFTVNEQAGVWRVLSGGYGGEWKYLLDTRATTYGTGAMSTDNHRYAEVKVNGVCGLLVFPDEFSWPSEAGTVPTAFNGTSLVWNNVNYTAEQFAVLETAGCVFLPCAGYHYGTSVYNIGLCGTYWSSTTDHPFYAYGLDVYSNDVNPARSNRRHYGRSVRLVCP